MKHGANMLEHEKTLLGMIVIGVAAVMGKFLLTQEPITWRAVIGRILVGGTTAMIAGAVLAIIPGVDKLAIYAFSALCGHAGAEVLMKYAGDYLNRKREG